MKLIHANDLKEYAQKLLVGEPINTHFGINLYKMFEEIIDHAPTVDVPENNERSQGKWIKKVDDVGFISHICSECGAEIDVEDPKDDKFCFNCGAEMKIDFPVVKEKSQCDWIPVSERLPEFTGLYLISIDNLVTAMSFDGTGFMNRGGVRIEVDAWMSLPKSYKKGSAE